MSKTVIGMAQESGIEAYRHLLEPSTLEALQRLAEKEGKIQVQMNLPEGCAFVQLDKGQVALVDADMADELSAMKWSVNPNGYAVCNPERGVSILMHRLVNQTPKGMETDHVNGVKLDNRRCNLRNATRTENARNRGANKSNPTGHKGVVRRMRKGIPYYEVRIWCNGKHFGLGLFSDPVTAAKVYDNAARDVHKEFCRENVPS